MTHSDGDMVERIARALDELPASRTWPIGGPTNADRARAAIEAMREPTEGMLAAGEEFHGYDMIDAQPDKWWQAMIDAALGDQE